MVRYCCPIAALLLLTVNGCLPTGEDSWAHYQGGGMYPARTPCMSPDGSVIVFSSPRTGNGDIYLIKRDGSNATRLTTSPAFETDPIFSPDGSAIAFTREVDSCRHIWLMGRDGSNQRQLTSGRVLDDVVSFSPDGSELNCNRSPLTMGLGRMATPHAVNVGSGRIRKLDSLPVYSPDGSTIACFRINESKERYEIWLMDADDSNRRFLVSGHSPRFSPDGKTILYTEENTHPGKLWKMVGVDGSNLRDLGMVEDPVFASDGRHILCLSPEWQRRIWVMDVAGSNRKELDVPTGYVDFFRPCRDGFIFKLVTNDRVGDIYVVNTDGWTVEHVTSMRSPAVEER